MQGTSLNDVIAVQTNHLSIIVDEDLDRHLATARSNEPVSRMQPRRLGLQLPFRFVPPVLEPDLDLCLGEVQGLGQVRSVWTGQIALTAEAPFQLEDLGV